MFSYVAIQGTVSFVLDIVIECLSEALMLLCTIQPNHVPRSEALKQLLKAAEE